jgi:hypothetical protein
MEGAPGWISLTRIGVSTSSFIMDWENALAACFVAQ